MPYNINDRALKIWAEKNLELLDTQGHLLKFRYHYSGSTCMDGGTPIASDVLVDLEDNKGELILRNFSVEQRDSDEGFECSCVGGTFHIPDEIESLRIIGKPLNEILEHEGPFNPAGCFCETPNILHKIIVILSAIRYYHVHPTE